MNEHVTLPLADFVTPLFIVSTQLVLDSTQRNYESNGHTSNLTGATTIIFGRHVDLFSLL